MKTHCAPPDAYRKSIGIDVLGPDRRHGYTGTRFYLHLRAHTSRAFVLREEHIRSRLYVHLYAPRWHRKESKACLRIHTSSRAHEHKDMSIRANLRSRHTHTPSAHQARKCSIGSAICTSTYERAYEKQAASAIPPNPRPAPAFFLGTFHATTGRFS